MYLEKQKDNITTGHSLKLVNNRYQYDLRKFSFAPRFVNVWNSSPEIVISAATTDSFKRLWILSPHPIVIICAGLRFDNL